MAPMDIEKRPALAHAGAYVIIDDIGTVDGRTYAGKMLIAFPRYGDGILRSALWDWSGERSRDIQNGKSDGCGCDKTAESLTGMIFGTGDREFKITGAGMEAVTREFKEHGYSLLWVV